MNNKNNLDFMKKIFLSVAILCSFFLVNAQKIDAIVAKQKVIENSELIGLSANDLKGFFVSNAYANEGSEMIYLNQEYKGLRVLNQMRVLAFKNDVLYSTTGSFLPEMEKLSNNAAAAPSINVAQAIDKAFTDANVSTPLILRSPILKEDARRKSFGLIDGVTEEVTTELLWVPVTNDKGFVSNVKLAWQVQVVPTGTADWWLIQVDATNGNIIGKINLTVYETNHNEDADFVRTNVQRQTNATSAFKTPLFSTGIEKVNSPTIVNGANYLVIPYPSESPQHPGGTAALRSNPWTLAPGNATSLNWHSDGNTDYTITRGNNTWTTEDRAATNGNTIITPTGIPATSSTSPDPLNFNFTPDYTVQPTTPTFQQFAITNLFYWNNIIHDLSYVYGFNEVSANFQSSNQGRGGNQNDYVISIAQSGVGVNNANFATPPDGSRPRMRMYLWDPGPNAAPVVVQVNTPASIAGNYTAVESAFSPNNKLASLGPITAPVVYYNDDVAGSTHYACSPPANTLTGKIVLIDRGFGGSVCTAAVNFTTKVKNAQDAGALAVIMINNVATAPIVMGGGPDATIVIPAVMVSQSDGALFVAQVANNLNITLSGGGVNIDGDLDNGIIVHEYGHGISNRFTGGGSVGCLNNAEQGGEGWSDYLGLMMTINWANVTTNDGGIPRGIGTYASGQAPTGQGIRPAPYSTNLATNSLTYANMGTNPYNNGITGTSPHAIGTIWCTALWEMTWAIIQQENAINPNLYNYTAAGNGGNSIALKLVMEGMRLQPCQPGYVDARNAILAADRNLYCGKHACAIWTAFAKRGLGFGADQGSSGSTSDQTASTNLPPAPTIATQPMDVSSAIGSNATFTANAGTDVNLIYQWQVSTDNGTTWTNINCSIFPSLVLTSVTSAMNGNKYRAQVYIGCAITTTNIVTLTVTGAPTPTITLTSAPSTSSQAVCINAAIANIVYSTSGGVTGATVTGLPAGVAGSYASGVFTISGTPTATGTFSYTITTSGGTPNATATGTITVNAATTLTLTSAAATTSQSVTVNSPITNITYSTANGVTGATVTGLPAGVTGVYSGGTNGAVTISGVPTAAGTFSYTVTTSGGCGVKTATGTITAVNGSSIALTSAAGSNNQSVCINAAIANIVYTAAGGVTGATVSGLPAGVIGAYSGGTNGTFTISGTPTNAGTFTYTITTSGGSSVASTSGTITVNPLVTLTLTSAPATTSQTVNINSTITNITYSTGGAVTGATVTGLPAGVTGIYSGGTNGVITISGTPTAAGTFSYTVTTLGGCGTLSRTGSIMVVIPPSITLSSAVGTNNQSVCLGNTVTPITYTTAGGVTGANTSGLPAGVTGTYSGGSNGTYSISGTPSATGTFNYTITTTGGVATATGSIIVNALPAAPGVTSPVVYCQGATATALTASGTGLLWYTVATGGTGSITAPTPITTNTGTTTYYVSQTINGCEGSRAAIVVNVNPTPGAPTVMSPVTICQGATATVLTAIGTNLLWYGTNATGGTGSATAPTPSTTTAGSTTYYVSQTTGICEGSRAAIVVTVTALPTVPTVLSPLTYCQGATATALTATGTGLLWFTTSTGGAGSATAPTPSTTAAGTVSYYVAQTNSCGQGARAIIVVNTTATPIAATNLTATNITKTSAVLNWNGAAGSFYTVEYKTAAASTWIVAATGITTNSLAVNNLTRGTTYNWRVYSNCSAIGGGNVSSIATFTTTTRNSNIANLSGGFGLRLTPNPIQSSGVLDYIVPNNGAVTITILTANGQIIRSIFNSNQAAGQYELNITNQLNVLVKGTYIIKLAQNGNGISIKFIKD